MMRCRPAIATQTDQQHLHATGVLLAMSGDRIQINGSWPTRAAAVRWSGNRRGAAGSETTTAAVSNSPGISSHGCRAMERVACASSPWDPAGVVSVIVASRAPLQGVGGYFGADTTARAGGYVARVRCYFSDPKLYRFTVGLPLTANLSRDSLAGMTDQETLASGRSRRSLRIDSVVFRIME